MADYDRPVTGPDVVAAAARLSSGVADAVNDILKPNTVVDDIEHLAQMVPPSRLGISPGAWNATFAPLFGEFE